VNIPARTVEVYSHPCADGYMEQAIYRGGAHIPVVLDGVEKAALSVQELFSED